MQKPEKCLCKINKKANHIQALFMTVTLGHEVRQTRWYNLEVVDDDTNLQQAGVMLA